MSAQHQDQHLHQLGQRLGRGIARYFPLRLATVAATALAAFAAGSVVGAPVAAAQPVTIVQPVQPAEAGPGELGEGAARAAAMVSGRRVEATALRTERQQVFAEPNGTFVLEQSVLPVRVRRGSGWAPVDTRLAVGADGMVAPVASTLDMAFSGGGDGPLVRLRRDGTELALRWPGKLPAPVLSGDTATYPQVLPGVDLVVHAGVENFSQVLVVKSAQAASNPALTRLRLKTQARGLRVRSREDGSLIAADAHGNEVFSAPSPYMWDSSPAVTARTAGIEPAGETVAARSLAPGGRVRPIGVRLEGGELSLLPDQQLLMASDTRYPVYIDPSWSGVRTGWTQVWSNYPNTSFYNGANLGTSENVARVGYDGTDGKNTRSFFKLDTTGVRGKHIIKATLQTYETWSRSCTTRQVEVWATNSISSSTTWSNQPTWAYRMDYKSIAKGFSSSCPAGGVEFNVTTQIVNAAKYNWTYVTQGIRASSTAESSHDTLSWKKFRNNPTVTIVYNTVPGSPTNLTTEGSAKCVTGASRLVIGKATPTLRATVSDADNAVKAHFQWFTLTGTTPIGEYTSASVAGKVPTTVAKAIPAGAFANGAIGRWRVRAEDGTDVSGWSPYCEFQVDTSRPPIPLATSTGFPDNGEGNAVMGVSLPVSISANGGTDVTRYEYTVNGDATALGSSATPAATGGSVNIAVLPDRFVNWLHVRAVDGANNRSDVATVVFYAAQPGPAVGDWPMDETGDGSAAVDISANARDAALGGGATWADGRYGGALHLDGATGYAATAGAVLDTTKSFSVSAWVRLADKSHNSVALSQVGSRAGAMTLYYSTAYDRWIFNRTSADMDGPTYIRAISTRVPVAGEWTHLIGVYDATAKVIKLYVDGVLEATTAFTTPWNAGGELLIGRSKVGGAYGEYWPGDMDTVRLYDRVLLTGEIQQVPRLTGHWKMDETSGTTAADAVGARAATWSATGVTRITGVLGNAVAVNGSTGVLSTSGPVIRTDGSFAVTAWVRPDALTKSGIAVSQLGAAVGGFNLGYSWDPVMGAYVWSLRTSATDSTGSAVREAVDLFDLPTVGTWTQLAAVYDAQAHKLRLYVNGLAVDETSHSSAWNAAGNLLIGRGQAADATFSQYFTGGIDDVRTYAGLLTDQEIFDQYSAVANVEPAN